MLVGPAKEAGMTVPEDVDSYDKDKFPHFDVFLKVQLGASMPFPTSHWKNAEIIARIPENLIKTITFNDLIEMGVETGTPIP